ncbi:hypothetical protein FKM82_014421 [Ascaphus truei]
MCSSSPRLWFLTDRRIKDDYPQQEILRALKAKCCEEDLEFRALLMDDVVLTIEQGNLGGVGMLCSLSEQGKQLAVQVSNILGMDVCGIDLLTKEDGSFCVCEANANVGFIAFDKACNLDVASMVADYALSLLPSRLTRRMSLLSVVSSASESSEPELPGGPSSAGVGVSAPLLHHHNHEAGDSMSASSSSVDSDPDTATERELLTKGAIFNMNQLLASEINLLVE